MTPRNKKMHSTIKYSLLFLTVFLIALATSEGVYYLNTTTHTTSEQQTTITTIYCPNPCTIVIQNSMFGNGNVVVKIGTLVTWYNNDSTDHTVSSNSGLWNSPILSTGQSFIFNFTSTGTYPYHDNIHPMTGEITVISLSNQTHYP